MQEREIVPLRAFFLKALLLCQLFIVGILFSEPIFAASLIDAKFKLQRKQIKPTVVTSNEIGVLYKDVLAKSMYSDCRWLPSDSQFMAIKSRQCGQGRGFVMAFSRFMTEHDANNFSKDIVVDNGRIHFINFGDGCEVF